MSAGYSLLMSFVVYIFRKELIAIFIIDPTTVETSLTVLYHIAPFYILFAVANIYTCAISGTGNTFIPMLINMFCYCFLRVVLYLCRYGRMSALLLSATRFHGQQRLPPAIFTISSVNEKTCWQNELNLSSLTPFNWMGCRLRR